MIQHPIDRRELTADQRVSLKLLTIIDPGDRTSNFIDLAEITVILSRVYLYLFLAYLRHYCLFLYPVYLFSLCFVFFSREKPVFSLIIIFNITYTEYI